MWKGLQVAQIPLSVSHFEWYPSKHDTAGQMARSRRRWAKIRPALCQRVVFAGIPKINILTLVMLILTIHFQ